MAKEFLKDLPDLIEKGIITRDIAHKINEYYNEGQQDSKDKLQIVLALLGALLVGLGILLILAHNWDNLSKSIKVILAFTPLVISHILIVYVLLRKSNDKKWKESVAAFNFIAIAISISLVSQIFHINGEFDDFVLIWMLLALPVVYILDSSMLSLLYIGGITVFVFNSRGVKSFLYIPLLSLILPYYFQLLKHNKFNNFTYFHNWFIALSVVISFPLMLKLSPEWIPMMFFGLFAMLYFIGKLDKLHYKNLIKNAFVLVSFLGTVVMLYIVSFEDYWNSLMNKSPFDRPLISIVFVLLLFAISLVLMIRSFLHKKFYFDPLEWGGVLFFVLFFLFVKGGLYPAIAVVQNKVSIFVMGIIYIVKGERNSDLILLNVGLLIVSVLIIIRFFDYDISFLTRGIVFIVIGICFFIANHLLMKRKKTLEI